MHYTLYAICLIANFLGATFNWSQMDYRCDLHYAICYMLHCQLIGAYIQLVPKLGTS